MERGIVRVRVGLSYDPLRLSPCFLRFVVPTYKQHPVGKTADNHSNNNKQTNLHIGTTQETPLFFHDSVEHTQKCRDMIVMRMERRFLREGPMGSFFWKGT